jgi:hypothetical protein
MDLFIYRAELMTTNRFGYNIMTSTQIQKQSLEYKANGDEDILHPRRKDGRTVTKDL